MTNYFPEPYGCSGGNVKVKWDLSDYATKADLKGTTSINTSELASKTGLASLNTNEEHVDVDKRKTAPSDLSKLSNVVDTDPVKKTVYDKLIIKENAIDTKIISTSGLVTKSQYG